MIITCTCTSSRKFNDDNIKIALTANTSERTVSNLYCGLVSNSCRSSKAAEGKPTVHPTSRAGTDATSMKMTLISGNWWPQLLNFAGASKIEE